ncbi:MAG: hypothetical protein P1Q69_18830, partial [Candidatus Thorarchaeota archaeon]|nr:hypothetical protein [Candidatus Thorarchaeota archaeon]
YVGDFSYTPMGYYGRFNGTGKFDQNWVQGTYLDQMEGRLWIDFEGVQGDILPWARPQTLAAEQKVVDTFNEARDYYNDMDWMSCYNTLLEAENWIGRLNASIYDMLAPEIEEWGYEGSIFSGDLSVWATITDDFSGVENVTVHVRAGTDEFLYPATLISGSWTTEVEQFPVDINIEMWVEATDKGLNTVISNSIIFEGGYGPIYPWENPLVIGSILIGSVALVIVIIWFIRKRSISAQ